jgi:hypothetical protein
MMMEAVSTPETSDGVHQNTKCNIPEDIHFDTTLVWDAHVQYKSLNVC